MKFTAVDCNDIWTESCTELTRTSCSESCGSGWQTLIYNCREGIRGKGKYKCTTTCNEKDCDNSKHSGY